MIAPTGGSNRPSCHRDTIQKDSIAPKPIDTSNQFLVCAKDDKIMVHEILVKHPILLTKEQAVNLAAWLVITADPAAEAFDRVVREIAKGQK